MPGELSAFLRDRRTGRQLSLRALSARSGVGKSTLSGWETGASQPCIPELARVLEALEVPPEQRQRALLLVDAPRGVRGLRAALPQEARSETALRVPVAGHLLRTMRRRCHLSLDQVARSLRVRPSTISRWETGESAPTGGRLEDLLDLLGAHSAERSVLAGSRRILPPAAEHAPLTLEQLTQQLEAFSLRMRRGERNLTDLEFLAWEASLWPLLLGSPAARILLADAWSRYAEWLAREVRLPEASEYAGRALNLVGGEPPPWRGGSHILARCVRAYAPVARSSSPEDASLRTLAWLRKWLTSASDPRLESAMYQRIAETAGLCVPELEPSLRSD